MTKIYVSALVAFALSICSSAFAEEPPSWTLSRETEDKDYFYVVGLAGAFPTKEAAFRECGKSAERQVTALIWGHWKKVRSPKDTSTRPLEEDEVRLQGFEKLKEFVRVNEDQSVDAWEMYRIPRVQPGVKAESHQEVAVSKDDPYRTFGFGVGLSANRVRVRDANPGFIGAAFQFTLRPLSWLALDTTAVAGQGFDRTNYPYQGQLRVGLALCPWGMTCQSGGGLILRPEWMIAKVFGKNSDSTQGVGLITGFRYIKKDGITPRYGFGLEVGPHFAFDGSRIDTKKWMATVALAVYKPF